MDGELGTDIHESAYAALRHSTATNNALYEHLITEVRDWLPGSRPQEIEDALNMACVALNKSPLEALLFVHEFLSNWTSIVEHRSA